MTTLAALCTLYHGNDPEHVQASLKSLAEQTRPADQIVIVVDGPISNALDQVVTAFAQEDQTVEVVRLATNQGAGPASQAGLERITAEWIARLDADDIATPERFATQLAFLREHPEIDVLGTALAEFETDPATIKSVRHLPETHDAIARYALLNSPVNNPSVMIRRSSLDKAGGYRDVHFMEDYDLYARLLASGARFHNMPAALTLFRVSDQQFARRTGKEMFAAEIRMQKNLVTYGLVNRPRAVLNVIVRSAYRLLPKPLLHRVYGVLFHSSNR